MGDLPLSTAVPHCRRTSCFACPPSPLQPEQGRVGQGSVWHMIRAVPWSRGLEDRHADLSFTPQSCGAPPGIGSQPAIKTAVVCCLVAGRYPSSASRKETARPMAANRPAEILGGPKCDKPTSRTLRAGRGQSKTASAVRRSCLRASTPAASCCLRTPSQYTVEDWSGQFIRHEPQNAHIRDRIHMPIVVHWAGATERPLAQLSEPLKLRTSFSSKRSESDTTYGILDPNNLEGGA